MTMTFYCHEWATLEPDAANEVTIRYRNSIERIEGDVGYSIRAFVDNEDLRGALLDSVNNNSHNEIISLQLVSGSQGMGYYKVVLTYIGATLITDKKCTKNIFYSRNTRIRYDEFVKNGDKLAHKMLIWPREFGILEISFSDLKISKFALPSRHYTSFGELVDGF